MREFILLSNHGRTKGDWKDLMSAGRMDIVAHSVISSLFLSNAIRSNVTLHIILNGPPDPPKHIEIKYEEGLPISKKDVGNLIRSSLWKYKPKKKIRAFPGVYIDKKSFRSLVEEKLDGEVYYLDKRGEDISKIKFGENPVFILGDHEGIPKQELRFLKKNAKAVSLGPNMYFTSQCISFLNIWLDRYFSKKI
jgi:tRNA (pseudouridine54-N1)-methyltransferase